MQSVTKGSKTRDLGSQVGTRDRFRAMRFLHMATALFSEKPQVLTAPEHWTLFTRLIQGKLGGGQEFTNLSKTTVGLQGSKEYI